MAGVQSVCHGYDPLRGQTVSPAISFRLSRVGYASHLK